MAYKPFQQTIDPGSCRRRRIAGFYGESAAWPCQNNRSGLADCPEAAFDASGPEMCHWGCVDSDNATGAITRIMLHISLLGSRDRLVP